MKALSRGCAPDGRPRNLDISGMSYRRLLEQRGLQWPMREGDETGAARLYADGAFPHADGRARLIPLPFVDNNEQPDRDYPFWLNSGRVVEHFHTRTKTGKVGNCNKFSPTPYLEMNPDAAAELGIAHMQYVRLVSRRGDAVVMVQLHPARTARHGIHTLPLSRLRQPPDAGPAGPALAAAGLQTVRRAHRADRSGRGGADERSPARFLTRLRPARRKRSSTTPEVVHVRTVVRPD